MAASSVGPRRFMMGKQTGRECVMSQFNQGRSIFCCKLTHCVRPPGVASTKQTIASCTRLRHFGILFPRYRYIWAMGMNIYREFSGLSTDGFTLRKWMPSALDYPCVGNKRDWETQRRVFL